MAASFKSVNMNLDIPIPTVQIGPDWAADIDNSLLIIDSHTHALGSGVQITPDGININKDLSFGSINNAINLRSVRFTPQLAVLPMTDVGAIYEVGPDLYYNNSSGRAVQITNGDTLAGAAGTISGLPSGTASASFISVQGTFQFQQATGVGANIDAATIIVRVPPSVPTPAGNFIGIQAPISLSSAYFLTLPALPPQTNVMVLGSTGVISSITYDDVGTNMTSVGANAIAASRTRATALGTNLTLGGIVFSASSGLYSTTSTVFTDVTNLGVTLVTSGRPVFITLQAAGSTECSVTGLRINNGTVLISFRFVRNAVTPVGFTRIQMDATGSSDRFLAIPGSSFSVVDFVPAGTHTYTFQTQVISTASTSAVNNCILVAYEL